MFDQINSIDLSPENIARINAVLSVLIPFLVVVGGGALAAYASKHLVGQLKGLWRVIRPQIPVVVAQIDEPTDEPIKMINKYSPLAAKMILAFGPMLIKALQAGLDELADVPQQEVAKVEAVEVRVSGG